jgi:F420-dependent oxidoreductase-like protein
LDVGVIIPQGFLGEYVGWQPTDAWARTVSVAQQAERLGFGSVWVFDHFQTYPTPTDEITFEPFMTLSAIAALTHRVRLGPLVACASYRNPALLAKMMSTLDSISGGRAELGLGAGWKRDEWTAYGYGFPDTRQRLGMLRDALEVVTRMLESPRDARATYHGQFASVVEAINVPKPVQEPRLPIVVGGNGSGVTWRLAARFADELNLDGMEPADVEKALPLIKARCEEIGRDPGSLRLSVNVLSTRSAVAGRDRVELLEAYRSAGVHRVQTMIRRAAEADDALESFAADAYQSGATLI